MTWSDVIATGRGKLRFAVVFEGWPEIWVTDPSITLTNSTYGARGRAVRVGLLSEGLRFSEQARMREGRYEASPMTFKFRSTTTHDYATLSFARVGQAVDRFAAALTSAATSISIDGTLSDGYYHAGTEAFYYRSGGASSRGQWDSQDQGFQVLTGDGRELPHRVYNNPNTLDGRRATLYVWGVGDDVTKYDPEGAESGAGVPIWRGVVNRPPRLDRDGVTWTVTADHIYNLFKQTIGSNDGELKAAGIYHNDAAPLVVIVGITKNGGSDQRSSQYVVSGPALDETGIETQINTMLADALAEITSSGVDSLRIEYTGTTWRLVMLTGASPPRFVAVNLYSPYVGLLCHVTSDFLWSTSDGTKIGNNPFADAMPASTELRLEIPRDAPHGLSMETTPQVGSGIFGPYPHGYPVDWRFEPFGSYLTGDNPVNRLYINRPWSDFIGVDAIAIDPAEVEYPSDYAGANRASQSVLGQTIVLLVTGSGTTLSALNYVDVEPLNGDDSFRGWITGNTNLRPVYSGGVAVEAMGFIETMIDDSKEYGNDGTRPFIRDVDVDTTQGLSGQLPSELTQRAFVFVKSVRLDDVIAEELKLTAHMWCTTSIGKLAFRPIPLTAETALTSKTIGASDILTPEGGNGAWPTYDIQSQGLCAVVTVKQGYDAYTDEFRGAEFVINNSDLLATHKKRGVSEITIAPKSNPLNSSPVEGDGGISVSVARQVATNMFSVFGREYATVRVRVPFSKFGYLLGDVVALTSPHVPNTDGTRGVTDKRCVVIGREWTLSGPNAGGEIELMLLLNPPKGYAPSGVITGQTNTTGNTWELTLSAANAINVLISPLGDGDVAGTFAAGDYIVVVNRTPGTNYTGTVQSVAGAVVTVDLDSSWTPGSSSWALEYQADSGSTATDGQREYVYVADSTARKADDSFASVFE